MTTLVVDANILAGALLGRSLPLIAGLVERGVDAVVPLQMVAETRAVLQHDGRLSPAEVKRRIEEVLTLVEPLGPEAFEDLEARARERLEDHAQSDWPVLALALALDAGIWTKDKDFFGVGVPVWAARNIRFLEAEVA